MNALDENRIYAVNSDGQLLSYTDDGTPGSVGHPVVVGNEANEAWQSRFLFAGANAPGENRIYRVTFASYGQRRALAPVLELPKRRPSRARRLCWGGAENRRKRPFSRPLTAPSRASSNTWTTMWRAGRRRYRSRSKGIVDMRRQPFFLRDIA